MRHPLMSKLALFAAIGAGLILAAPAAAQASTSALSSPATSVAVPNGEIWWFSGYTYPDTSAGYSACVAEGVYERSHGVSTYSCWLDNPDAGLYGLWLADVI
jgi:hypothetical protein